MSNWSKHNDGHGIKHLRHFKDQSGR
jgi:hypothetical protein